MTTNGPTEELVKTTRALLFYKLFNGGEVI